jgi:hypothetical protein
MLIMADLKSVPMRSPSIVTRKTGNEYVLVPVANNIADMDSVYTLNETGAFIWDLIDGEKCVKDLIGAVIKEYDTDTETATNDVLSFIDAMSKYLIIKE